MVKDQGKIACLHLSTVHSEFDEPFAWYKPNLQCLHVPLESGHQIHVIKVKVNIDSFETEFFSFIG